MYTCRLCHAENKPSAKFCRRCGVARPEEDATSAAAAMEPAHARNAPPENGEATSDKRAEEDPRRASAGEREQPVKADSAVPQETSKELPVEESSVEEAAEQLCRQEQSCREQDSVPPAAAVDEPPAAQTSGEVRRGGPACIACGTAIRALDKFCIWCGEKQPERAPPQMKRCAECRTHLPVSANFCYVCGNDVGTHQRRRIRVPTELFQEEDPELFPTFET